jgi:hypothetical protein
VLRSVIQRRLHRHSLLTIPDSLNSWTRADAAVHQVGYRQLPGLRQSACAACLHHVVTSSYDQNGIGRSVKQGLLDLSSLIQSSDQHGTVLNNQK